MTNQIIFPAEYGRERGRITSSVQDSPVAYTIYARRRNGDYIDITGASIDAKFKNQSTGTVYDSTGTFTITNGQGGCFTWLPSAADLGIAGDYYLQFTIDGERSEDDLAWEIQERLDSDGSNTPTALVALTAAQVALVQAISALTGLMKMAAGTATGIAIQSFMETFLASATKITARLNLLPSYTGNTGKVLAVNGAEDDVEWVEQSSSAIDSVFGRTGAVVAASGDYGTDEIADDSDYAKPSLTAALNAIAQTDANQDLSIAGKQDASAKLTAIAALTWAANSIIQLTGASAAAVVTLASHVWTFLQSADAAAARTAIGAGTGNGDLLAANNLSDVTASTARTNLGLGTLATQSGTFSGSGTLATGGFTLTVPATGTAALLATANTFTAAQTVSMSSASPGMSVLNTGSGSGVRGNGTIGIEAYTSNGVPLHAVMQGASSTTTVNTTIKMSSRASGTPGAGFGTNILWQLETSTTNDTDAGQIAVLWNTATHASRAPDMVALLTDAGAEREIWRGRATGSAAAIGFLGATPVARQAHIADAAGDDAATVNAILDVLEAFGLVATA